MAARRDLVWLIGGRLATALVALVAIRVSTHLLPPDEYGLLAVLVTFQMFCGLFIVNPVGQYINRHTHAWSEEGSLLPRLKRYRAFVAMAGLAGALSVAAWGFLQGQPWFITLAQMGTVGLMVVAVTWNATWVSLLNMLGYRGWSVLWATGTAAFSLFFSWCLTSMTDSGLAWFAGQMTGLAIGALGAGLVLRRLAPAPVAGDWQLISREDIRRYCLPMAAATGFMWFLVYGYRLLLEYHWGLAALGMAVVGLGLAQQLWALCESLVMQFLFPLFFKRISAASGEEGGEAFSDLLNSLAPVYLVLLGVTLLAASSLLKLLVADAYQSAIAFVWIGAVVEFSRATGNLFATATQVSMRMQALILPYALSAAVLATCLALAGMAGSSLMLAAGLLAVVHVLSLLLMAWRMSREAKLSLDGRRWLAGLLASVACAAGAWFFPVVQPSFAEALEVLAAGGVLAVLLSGFLLWKNPALGRLMSVKLRVEG